MIKIFLYALVKMPPTFFYIRSAKAIILVYDIMTIFAIKVIIIVIEFIAIIIAITTIITIVAIEIVTIIVIIKIKFIVIYLSYNLYLISNVVFKLLQNFINFFNSILFYRLFESYVSYPFTIQLSQRYLI
jgi:hypothetical protein